MLWGVASSEESYRFDRVDLYLTPVPCACNDVMCRTAKQSNSLLATTYINLISRMYV